MEAAQAQPDHVWGNPEDCPGCLYSKAVVERQSERGLIGKPS